MSRATVRRRVALTPAQLWDVLTDRPGMSTWAPGVQVSVEKPGALDPHAAGTVRSVSGPTIRELVTTFHPNLRLGYRAVSGMSLRDYAGTVQLTPAADKTEVT
jgi:hypothetical protein